MPTAATVSPAEYPTQYDFLLSFARGCPDFPYSEAGVVKGVNAKEGQTIYDYITEFFDDDMGTEDFDTVDEIHLKKFGNTNLSERSVDYAETDRKKRHYPGLYPQEPYALTALARMSVNKTLTNLKFVLGEKFSKESTEDWVKTLYTKGNKGYCIGMWRLLALTHYLNSGVHENPRLCCALTPVTDCCDGPCEDDEMEKVVVKTKKTKKTKKQEEINMDMIKEFISKATSDQIKEISKSCMDRQEGLSAFERLAVDSEPIAEEEESEEEYECPEGWFVSEFEGVKYWEHEVTSEICKPCENVEEAPKGKWKHPTFDSIIWQ